MYGDVLIKIQHLRPCIVECNCLSGWAADLDGVVHTLKGRRCIRQPGRLQLGTCEASRFDSNSNWLFRFDSTRKWWADSKICELPIARRSQTTQTINCAYSGTAYRLVSSMNDHTPALFNVFEDWYEESVVPHISFVSFVINFWLLNLIFVGTC